MDGWFTSIKPDGSRGYGFLIALLIMVLLGGGIYLLMIRATDKGNMFDQAIKAQEAESSRQKTVEIDDVAQTSKNFGDIEDPKPGLTGSIVEGSVRGDVTDMNVNDVETEETPEGQIDLLQELESSQTQSPTSDGVFDVEEADVSIFSIPDNTPPRPINLNNLSSRQVRRLAMTVPVLQKPLLLGWIRQSQPLLLARHHPLPPVLLRGVK